MERNIIDYLPHVLRDYREIKGIADGQQWLFEMLWNAVEEVFRNQYIETADSNGIRLFEQILGIVPKGSETPEERRFRVQVRWNQAQLPYTYRSLRQYLASVTEDYETRLDANAYTLYLRVRLGGYRRRDALLAVLRKMIPANLTLLTQTDIPQKIKQPQLTIATGAYTMAVHRHQRLCKPPIWEDNPHQVRALRMTAAVKLQTTIKHRHKGV